MTPQVNLPEDAEIIALYWDRDENAIRLTDLKYRQYLLTVAQNILYNMQDCEECLNDTYLRTWNTIPPTRPSVFKTFLAAIIRRIAIDNHRKRTQRKSIPPGLYESFEDFQNYDFAEDGSYEEQDVIALASLLDTYVKSLPDRRRYVFVARYFLAWPAEQIASRLGCSRATVFKEIAAIRDSLREYLAKEGYTV